VPLRPRRSLGLSPLKSEARSPQSITAARFVPDSDGLDVLERIRSLVPALAQISIAPSAGVPTSPDPLPSSGDGDVVCS
jgi:hypothetical protein